jgi:hypothetical protein
MLKLRENLAQTQAMIKKYADLKRSEREFSLRGCLSKTAAIHTPCIWYASKFKADYQVLWPIQNPRMHWPSCLQTLAS